jgi:hypothetical protein
MIANVYVLRRRRWHEVPEVDILKTHLPRTPSKGGQEYGGPPKVDTLNINMND